MDRIEIAIEQEQTGNGAMFIQVQKSYLARRQTMRGKKTPWLSHMRHGVYRFPSHDKRKTRTLNTEQRWAMEKPIWEVIGGGRT